VQGGGLRNAVRGNNIAVLAPDNSAASTAEGARTAMGDSGGLFGGLFLPEKNFT
jgi:hypothetical protein